MKIIAEIANAHDGSLGTAHAFIDAAIAAAADGVKFQCHYGDPVSEFRPGTYFPQDASRRDYWSRIAFTPKQWRELREHANQVGLEFGVSCFSMDAFDQMNRVGVDFWKIGAAQTSDHQLIRAMAKTRKPLIISSGMSGWAELDAAVEAAALELAGPLTILQCSSSYPTEPENIGLNVMAQIRQRYECQVGLSDHSGMIWPGILAAYQGANLLEVHLCLSKFAFGPDVPASLTPEDLAELVEASRWVSRMKPLDKNEYARRSEIEAMRTLFRREASASL